MQTIMPLSSPWYKIEEKAVQKKKKESPVADSLEIVLRCTPTSSPYTETKI